MIKTYKNYIVVALVIGIATAIVIYTLGLRSTINDQKKSIKTLTKELVESKSSNLALKGSIESRNRIIESQRLDVDNTTKTLHEWKALPPEIRYKDVIKYKEVKSNDCNEIKAVIDSIRNTSF